MYETGVAMVIQPHYNVDVLYPVSRMHLGQYKAHQLHWGDSGMYTSDKLHSIYASLMVCSPLYKLLYRMLPTMFDITLTITYQIKKYDT